MPERVHIFVDQMAVQPVTYKNPRITVCRPDGTELHRTKRVSLKGNWIIRQYNNPVPCGATIVLFPADDSATYIVEVT